MRSILELATLLAGLALGALAVHAATIFFGITFR